MVECLKFLLVVSFEKTVPGGMKVRWVMVVVICDELEAICPIVGVVCLC